MKLGVGLILGTCCIGTLGHADIPVTPLASPEKSQAWPISFETLTHKITVTFPVPSREVQQENRSNRLYLAQQMAQTKDGKALRETFSLVYQEQPLFSEVPTNVKAIDLANSFEEAIKKITV